MSIDKNDWLVSTGWLNDNLDDNKIRVLDVSAMLTKELRNIASERVYDQGHIPGAVFLDVAGGRGPLADPDAALPFTWPAREQVDA